MGEGLSFRENFLFLHLFGLFFYFIWMGISRCCWTLFATFLLRSSTRNINAAAEDLQCEILSCFDNSSRFYSLPCLTSAQHISKSCYRISRFSPFCSPFSSSHIINSPKSRYLLKTPTFLGWDFFPTRFILNTRKQSVDRMVKLRRHLITFKSEAKFARSQPLSSHKKQLFFDKIKLNQQSHVSIRFVFLFSC